MYLFKKVKQKLAVLNQDFIREYQQNSLVSDSTSQMLPESSLGRQKLFQISLLLRVYENKTVSSLEKEENFK